MSVSTSQTPAALSPEQVRSFLAEGYLLIPQLFSDDDLAPTIAEISDEIDRVARRLYADGKLSSTFSELGFERRLAAITAECDEVYKSVLAGRLCGPAIFGLISNPKLLDAMEALVGPEIIASSVYRIRPKMPGHSWGPVPWHQDSGYFEPFCDKSLIVTCWLPLVDATELNGCLWLLPRGHRRGIAPHVGAASGIYLEIPPGDLPPGQPIPVPVPKGGVLLMTNMTPHASFDNKTDLIRWSIDLRYQSARVPTNAAIDRLPDDVRHGDQKDVPTACYPPEADFLVRSRLRKDQTITSAADFARLRKGHLSKPVTDRWGATFIQS